jgi:outer membrane murein-binding lipoprotein Lpp
MTDKLEQLKGLVERLRHCAGCIAAGLTTVPVPALLTEAATALHELLAEIERLTAERDEARAKFAAVKGDSNIWPLEARDAVDAVEEHFDISVCSSQHMAEWVDRFEAAEAEIERLRGALGNISQNHSGEHVLRSSARQALSPTPTGGR